MFKRKSLPPSPLIPLPDLITSLRVMDQVIAQVAKAGYYDGIYIAARDYVEREILRHGYRKIDGNFYKESDLKLLTPLAL